MIPKINCLESDDTFWPHRSCYPEVEYLEDSPAPAPFYPNKWHSCERDWPDMSGRELQISLSYTFKNPGQQALSAEEWAHSPTIFQCSQHH